MRAVMVVALMLMVCAPRAVAGTCWDAIRKISAPREMAAAAGEHFGLPRWLLPAVVDRENAPWDPIALSSKGARGLGQVMPATVAMKRGITRPSRHLLAIIDIELREPRANLCWAARILADSLRICRRDQRGDPSPEAIACALAGYNAGEGVADYVSWITRRAQEEAR